MPSEHLIREDRGPVTELTLNRPDTQNALSQTMLIGLRRQLLALMHDDRQRVVILKGAGGNFCAGHDLAELQAMRGGPHGGAAGFGALFDDCAEVMQIMQRLPQPVIAQVHGDAASAGCQLVASCDLVVAAESARFGVNGIDMGLFCATPMVALSRIVTRRPLFEMLMTGDLIDAAQAKTLGLINSVVAPAQLPGQTRALADRIAGKPAEPLRLGKRAFYDQIELPLSRAYEMARAVMVETMLNAESDTRLKAQLAAQSPAAAE